MSYYKSVRFIDGKLKTVITDENDNIIQNPTKDQIKLATFYNKKKKRNIEERRCCKCGNTKTYISPRGVAVWYAYYDEKGNWDERSYLCAKCYQKYDDDSINNIRKIYTYCRTRKFDILSNRCKGCIGAHIVGRSLGVKDLNIEMDNFNYYVDLSQHSKYGYIEVKTATLINDEWHFAHFKGRIFDTLFLICMDKNWKNIERVYVIPWREAIKRDHIAIKRNSIRTTWCDGLRKGYRIDEMFFNNVYQKIDITRCMILNEK